MSRALFPPEQTLRPQSTRTSPSNTNRPGAITAASGQTGENGHEDDPHRSSCKPHPDRRFGRIGPVQSFRRRSRLANPLGSRALYLRSSIYRIHRTNQPSSRGKAQSSGCIRMANEDVEHLYAQVSVGATVVVRD